MALSPWWQVATVHRDIREGKLTESVFAADLADVLAHKASPEYRDAAIFFQRTYLTQGLKKILKNVISRLSGKKGDSVIQLQTPFGGGKTHTLVALYHAVKESKSLSHVPCLNDLPALNDPKIAVFVGTQSDALHGKTPWGEIAWQLGEYEKIQEHDEKRRSPGRTMLEKILGESPVLILIDELVPYLVKGKDFGDQIAVFCQELTETVKSKENCCLICTLPSSAPYGEEGERALREISKIFGRVKTIYTPVEGEEIYQVIRKRLFEEIGDEAVRKEVAQYYWTMYQKLGADISSEIKEVAYRDKIERAYPIHPELIDVLYEHWGSYPNFQRTRGVLALLAKVVADLLGKKEPAALIQSSMIDLSESAIGEKFLENLGREFNSIIASDIAGSHAKAGKIDREMGSEYSKYSISQGIATAVFLYSFSGSLTKKETSLPEIRVSLLREGIPPTIVGDAVNKLEQELWYFHAGKGKYSFRNQPNLTRVIVDREETIAQDTIVEETKKLIGKQAGRALEIYIWPEKPSDIPDTKNLKLTILTPDFAWNSEEDKKKLSGFFEQAGNGFRIYKNTLFIALADQKQYAFLSKTIQRFLALDTLSHDDSLLQSLPKQSQEELKKKFRDMEKDIPFKILHTHSSLVVLEKEGIVIKDLGIPTAGNEQTISARVKQYLQDQQKLLTNITAKYLLDRTFSKEENQKTIREIYEVPLKTPGLPLPESEQVVLTAVAEGIRSGILELHDPTETFNKDALDIEMTVVRGDVSKPKEASSSPEPQKTAFPETQKGTKNKRNEDSSAPSAKMKNVTFKAQVPWDKLSTLITGVIRPLKDKGEPPEITIEIKARSQEGYDRTTLDTRVRETLRQINAIVETWEEE